MAPSLPSHMRAIVISGTTAKVTTRPVPSLRPDYVLSRVHAIALNPTDWKHVAGGLCAPNGGIGVDYSGTIVAVGANVTTLKVGDRVAGFVHGGNANDAEGGAFAEYTLSKEGTTFKIPDSLSFEEAATLPCGLGTVGQGLYDQALGLELPVTGGKETKDKGEDVLIYGGSTATGSLGIQLAKLSGYRVLTTCSPKNDEFVKERGADKVYDYHDKDVGAKIRKDTDDKLKYAWDTISLEQSAQICADALSSDGKGAKYGSILSSTVPRDDGVQSKMTLLYTSTGEAFDKFGHHFEAQEGHLKFSAKFYPLCAELIAEGKLKPHPTDVRGEGLKGALQGMKDMQAEKVSAQKLVYRVQDTPEGEVEEDFGKK